MIRHLLKLVWNRKRANALIMAEIFVSFLVVFAVLTGSPSAWPRAGTSRSASTTHNVWDVSMDFDDRCRREGHAELHATVMRMLDEARRFPEVRGGGLSNTPAYAFSTSERDAR